MRRKDEEYTERIFHFQKCLETLKGQIFKKYLMGGYNICRPSLNSLQVFFVIFKQKLSSLHIWRMRVTAKNEGN
jgi:hypothetical protein